MKVMVMVRANKDTEAGKMPSEELLRDMGNFNAELVKAGVILAGEGLHPSVKGKRISFKGKQSNVIDGPFTESKELIAGFWLWQVKSMEEAVAWARRMPNYEGMETELELRQVFSPEDFGPALTPELRAQEQELRAQAAANSS